MTASVIPKGSPEVIEKWREEFLVEMRKMGYDTESVVDDYYKRNPHLRDPKIMDHYFRVWVASRQSATIELPKQTDPRDFSRQRDHLSIAGKNKGIDICREFIESQGYKVEVKDS